MSTARVKDVMTPDPVIISPMKTAEGAVRMMREGGCGILPVGYGNNVIGVITDRDIMLRLIANNKKANLTAIADIMTPKAYSCHEGDSLATAAALMSRHHIGRLLVTNDWGRVTGIVTLAELTRAGGDRRLAHKVWRELQPQRAYA